MVLAYWAIHETFPATMWPRRSACEPLGRSPIIASASRGHCTGLIHREEFAVLTAKRLASFWLGWWGNPETAVIFSLTTAFAGLGACFLWRDRQKAPRILWRRLDLLSTDLLHRCIFAALPHCRVVDRSLDSLIWRRATVDDESLQTVGQASESAGGQSSERIARSLRRQATRTHW